MFSKFVLLMIIVYIILCLFVWQYLSKKEAAKEVKKTIIRSKSKSFLYGSYTFLDKNYFVSKYLRKVRKKIELVQMVDEWTIRKQTMKIVYKNLIITGLALATLLIMSDSLYFVLVSILIVYVLHEGLLEAQLSSIEDKVLHQLGNAVEDIAHYYYKNEIVEDALYETIEVCGYEVGQHLMEIHNILESSNLSEEKEKYFDRVSNVFLKKLLAISELILVYGDKKVDGKSLFLKNIRQLKEDIQTELLKREKIKEKFACLTGICIIPLFVVKPFEIWVVNNMVEVASYYDSAYGLVIDILLFVLVLASYQMVRKFKNFSHETNYSYDLEEMIYKIKPVKRLIIGLRDKKYTRTLKIRKLLKTTGIKVKVEAFYVREILYAIGGFCLSLVIFMNGIHIDRQNILLYPLDLERFETNHNINEMSELRDIEKDFVIQHKGLEPTYEEIEQALLQRGVVDEEIISHVSGQMLNKFQEYRMNHFEWWHLMIILMISICSYYIPIVILYIRKNMIERMMNEEVFQLQTILLILINIDKIYVDDILEWMGQFSQVFKESILKCVTNYEYNDDEALEQLKQEEQFLPFVRIVENLQVATDKISIRQAFDNLEADRLYYVEKRKQENSKLITERTILGQVIAFVPTMFVMIAYIVIPFMGYSMSYMNTFSQQMQTII